MQSAAFNEGTSNNKQNQYVAVMAPTAFGIKEAAAYISCGRSSIYRLMGSGDLHCRKLGRRTLILKRDLDALLDRLPQGSGLVGGSRALNGDVVHTRAH